MVHGLQQIKEMNENAVKVHEAKKQGLVGPDYPEHAAVPEVNESRAVVKDLGWANGWKETPDIIKRCRQLGHKVQDRADRPFGHTHEVRCDTCGYKYKYDSS